MFKKALIILCLITTLAFGFSVFAHELLPKPVVEFMERNPNATPEEIQAFVEAKAPELGDKYKDKEEIVKIVRNQDSNLFDNAWDFMKLGIEHILSGADHILFVISLLLVFISFREILKLTFTFTIAHSITLILSGLGAITLNTKVTEPLIALSITYVAITSVFFRNKKIFESSKAKMITVFFFGLFHGLSFAGLLKEIHIPSENFISSLFSFNLGIELGQLSIVAIVLPLVLYIKNKTWYSRFIQVLAIVIGILGIMWAAQRIFG